MSLKLSVFWLFIFTSTFLAKADLDLSNLQKLKVEAEALDSADLSIQLLDEYLSENGNVNKAELAEFYFLVGNQYYELREYMKSLSFLLKSKELVLEDRSLRELEFEIVQKSALIHFFLNSFDEANNEFKEALVIAEDLGMTPQKLNCIYNIALSFRKQGDYGASTEMFLKCLELAKSNGMSEMVSSSLCELGWNSEDLGDLDEAARLYYESGQVSGIGEESIAISELNVGLIYMKQKRYDKALSLIRSAERRMNEDYLMTYIPILYSLGEIYYHLKSYDSALVYLNKGFNLNFNPSGQPHHPAELKESFEYLKLVAVAKNDSDLLEDLGIIEKMAQNNSELENSNVKLMVKDFEIGLQNQKLEKEYLIWVISASMLMIAIISLVSWLYYSRQKKRNKYKTFIKELDQTLVNP
ncbi:tetratricopeptide repeat protein [Reichenbachiella versicolor]|uniref:tetratricopeptide repeat protein n=1 Tax=Reichenbachiella versicolor TaxID=1821036 RepID=UPI000D6E4C8F|nr:tetratricopeptide repeat protein [Reichenbachiella versicolor]